SGHGNGDAVHEVAAGNSCGHPAILAIWAGIRNTRHTSDIGSGRAWCYPSDKVVAALNMWTRGFLGTRRKPWSGVCIALIGSVALVPRWAGATAAEAPPPAVSTTAIEELADIM